MAWMRECTGLVDMLYVSLKVAKTLGHVVFRGMTEVVKNAFEHVDGVVMYSKPSMKPAAPFPSCGTTTAMSSTGSRVMRPPNSLTVLLLWRSVI